MSSTPPTLDDRHRSLMRRADLVLNVFVPKHFPVLLDALAVHATQSLKTVEPRYLLNEDWKAFALGEVAEPSNLLMVTADQVGTTPEEMAERFRAHDAAQTPDFHSTRAVYFGQVLASSSVQSRHAIYCTEEMTALVRSAANSQVAESALSEADLPSRTGVAFLYDRTEPMWLRWATTSNGLVSANLADTKGLQRLLSDDFSDGLSEV